MARAHDADHVQPFYLVVLVRDVLPALFLETTLEAAGFQIIFSLNTSSLQRFTILVSAPADLRPLISDQVPQLPVRRRTDSPWRAFRSMLFAIQ